MPKFVSFYIADDLTIASIKFIENTKGYKQCTVCFI